MEVPMIKAMDDMKIEDDDTPFRMPDLPEFSSSERNKLSIVGRILNPRCQKMASLILDMPRKWQKVGKVRGVALTKEKFQFFFDTTHDLEEVMDKGAQTFNDWNVAMEKWEANTPKSYLQTIPLWVQIRNFPINYYTVPAITAVGEQVGRVLEVNFDPTKPMTREFVRVKILFNIDNPLRKSKLIQLPHGEMVRVNFHYEKVQKRCYRCQRLTHELDYCPQIMKQGQERSDDKTGQTKSDGNTQTPIIKPNDPLYGVLTEEQVGFDPITCTSRMTEDVLNHLRLSLIDTKPEKLEVEKEKIRRVVNEEQNNCISQRRSLNMLPFPKITSDMDKGKGKAIAAEETKKTGLLHHRSELIESTKMMADAMKLKQAINPIVCGTRIDTKKEELTRRLNAYKEEAAKISKKPKTFKRLNVKQEQENDPRRIKTKGMEGNFTFEDKGQHKCPGRDKTPENKRKIVEDEMTIAQSSKRAKSKVVLKEGLPKPK